MRFYAFRKYKSHNKIPPPSAENKYMPGWFIHVLAVSAFIQAHYIPWTTFVPHFAPLHFILLSFHAHTSAPHSLGSFLSFHSASSINPVSNYPSHLPTHYQWYVFIFCDVFDPIKRLKIDRKVITPNRWVNQAYHQPENNAPKTTYDLYACFLFGGSIKVTTGFS